MTFKNPIAVVACVTLLTLLSTTSVHSAWVWVDQNGDQSLSSGSSGSFSMLSAGANYDIGNAVNSSGWDRAPEPIQITYEVANGEEVSFSLKTLSPVGPGTYYTFVSVDIDADGDNILADSIDFKLELPFGLTSRMIGESEGFGALGMGINATALTMDAAITYRDGLGDQIMLDTAVHDFYYSSTPGDHDPTSIVGGVAMFNDFTGGADPFPWRTLSNGGANESLFPHLDGSTVPNQTQVVGGIDYVFSDFKLGLGSATTFELSFDGGVPALSVAPVPEPSVGMFLMGCLAFTLARRKRGS